MQLHLDPMGRIPADYPARFWRVSTWRTDYRLADFDNEAEAKRFAVEDSGKGNLDHKVATMNINRAAR